MLANTSKTVTICTLFDKFFGEKVYEQRINEKENIKVIQNVALTKIIGTNKLETLEFTNLKTNEQLTINPKGLFIAIGNIPDNKRFENLVKLDKEGYIQTNDKLETETEGLFAIGDCRKKDVRQITTAVSDGSIASFYALNHLEKVK